MSFGGIATGAGDVRAGTSDLVVQILLPTPATPILGNCSQVALYNCADLSGNPLYTSSAYTQVNSSEIWFASVAQSSVALVPEPASLALLSTGLLGLGLIGRRKQG